ncbi:MAG: hypothetical protein KC736_01205 [Candidatus Moranbacteria bacterium]|nr:hypothetical protein [Candidatus Moranbacteria bacterium]
MRNILSFLAIILVISAETAIVPLIQKENTLLAAPSLIVSYAVALVVAHGFMTTWKKIIIIGFVADIALSTIIGSHIILLIVCAYGANVLMQGFVVKQKIWTIVLITAMSLFQTIATTIMYQLNSVIKNDAKIIEVIVKTIEQMNAGEIIWATILTTIITMTFIILTKNINTFLLYYEQTVDVRRHS